MAKRPRKKPSAKRKGSAASRPVIERDSASSCPNCNGPISLLDAFCPACGTLLDEEE